MKFKIDNDMHIHSRLSLCSGDPEQTNERILRYGEENGLTTLCLTNHFWDEKVPGCGGYGYEIQNFPYIMQAKPLPQSKNVRFLFGCETEMNKEFVIGLSRERMDAFDFIQVPITHLHFPDFTLRRGSTLADRARAWIDRFDAVLKADLPFYKVGLPHLTGQIAYEMDGSIPNHRLKNVETRKLIPDSEMYRLFDAAAKKGIGIELNACCFDLTDEEFETLIRPYKIAKECGCKFYCGTDSHKVVEFANLKFLNNAVEWLDLHESDKYDLSALKMN